MVDRSPAEPETRWITTLEAEPLLMASRRQAEFASLKARALVRLNPPVNLEDWASFDALAAPQKAVLRLSQAAYAATQGRSAPKGGGGRAGRDAAR